MLKRAIPGTQKFNNGKKIGVNSQGGLYSLKNSGSTSSVALSTHSSSTTLNTIPSQKDLYQTTNYKEFLTQKNITSAAATISVPSSRGNSSSTLDSLEYSKRNQSLETLAKRTPLDLPIQSPGRTSFGRQSVESERSWLPTTLGPSVGNGRFPRVQTMNMDPYGTQINTPVAPFLSRVAAQMSNPQSMTYSSPPQSPSYTELNLPQTLTNGNHRQQTPNFRKPESQSKIVPDNFPGFYQGTLQRQASNPDPRTARWIASSATVQQNMSPGLVRQASTGSYGITTPSRTHNEVIHPGIMSPGSSYSTEIYRNSIVSFDGTIKGRPISSINTNTDTIVRYPHNGSKGNKPIDDALAALDDLQSNLSGEKVRQY
ncbi:hypothetical protein HK096_000393 [Nowakowskiella sp. JEL0078]|nr:hypothetical protein HK096_000393 [Nowakowskiella sp. JEL0078]